MADSRVRSKNQYVSYVKLAAGNGTYILIKTSPSPGSGVSISTTFTDMLPGLSYTTALCLLGIFMAVIAAVFGKGSRKFFLYMGPVAIKRTLQDMFVRRRKCLRGQSRNLWCGKDMKLNCFLVSPSSNDALTRTASNCVRLCGCRYSNRP